MKASNRELVDRLAAEYVLGTLRGRARRRFERWLVSPQVMQMVNAWEERLAGLEPSLEKVTPPATVWRGIESRLELGRSGRARAVRWMALAASVLLAVFGFFALRPSPDLVATATCIDRRMHAQTIYWRVELLGDNQQLQRAGPVTACARRRQGTRVVDPAGAGQPGIPRPAAGQRRAAAASSPPRSAPRSSAPNNSRSASSPPGGRRPGFRPGRFCTSHPCLQPEWPA